MLCTTALMIMLAVAEETTGRPNSRSHVGIKRSIPGVVNKLQTKKHVAWDPLIIPRGGDLGTPVDILVEAATETAVSSSIGPLAMMVEIMNGLKKYMHGPKADTLILLLTTALNNPVCQKLKISPILGFLSLGLLFGPNGKNLIKDVHTTEMMADLGIVLFLFEMGIHLDFKTLMDMKKDVFGIGLSQFTITGVVIAAICASLNYSAAATVIIGWSLALSSSAFVLQLLKDKDQMNTQYGKSSFGTLLLQDLMVVPLLVLTPILAGNGGSVGQALGKAFMQITIALSAIGVFGKFIMNPMFDLIAGAGSQEAFIGGILATVLGMSFMTEGLGLSNTLGAFLSGMLLADTKHKHHIELEAGPFRGILVGLFFFTVGFEIDVGMIVSSPMKTAGTVIGILTLKAAIASLVCKGFGLPWSIAQRVGLVLSQGGEFAFVAFRTARSSGILSEKQTKFLLTCVSLTMALTPSLEEVGSQMAAKLELKEAKTTNDIQVEEVVIESITVPSNEQEVVQDVTEGEDEIVDETEDDTTVEAEVEGGETEVDDDDAEVESVEAEVQESETDVESVEAEVQDSETDVDDEETEVQDSETDVDDEETDVNNDDAEVEGGEAEAEAQDSETEVDDDEAAVEDNKAKIEGNEADAEDTK